MLARNSVLYLTTLAEPLDKFIVLVKYSSLTFRKLVFPFYEDLGYVLRETGIETWRTEVTVF